MLNDRTERERYILDLLAQDGSLSVTALSRDLGVSEVTIRANLKNLEKQGLLSRTWGGAKPTSMLNVLDRVKVNEVEKDRIAQAAAAMVQDDDRIMIEAGTTNALIAKYLTTQRGVQIVTNSLLLLTYARANRELDVLLTGGEFLRETESMVGPTALEMVRTFNARIAFVGTDGFTADRGITTRYAQGAAVSAAMAKQAEEVWLVADSSKYGRAGFVNVLEMSELTGIITDKGLRPESKEVLEGVAPRVHTL